jgi:hypothetical protein
MTQVTNQPAAGGIHQAAEAVLMHYRLAPAVETERAIAMLALWALDAVEGGRLSAHDADEVFTLLDTEIGETKGGPELSEDAAQLLIEGMTLHDWGTTFSADPDRMRSLAFSILQGTA